MSLDAAIDEAMATFPSYPEGDPVPASLTTRQGVIDEDAFSRLAAMKPIDYERVRESEAARLKIRVGVLDKEIAARRREQEGPVLDFADVAPWPAPIDPSDLLTEISDTVRRFIVCQEETAHAVALWVAMTWLMDVIQVAPLAVITAPEKRCGKSQLLFLLAKLVHRPLMASNISPAALFRSIDAWHPTLLVDEADSFMKENEELRGLLNCGHTRDSAYVVRVVGDDHIPKMFNVWGAKAIAGIGHLAETLMDRAITLELRRKMPHEKTDRLRYAETGLFDLQAAKLARFAQDYLEVIRLARPALPESLNDRAQDNWEPLLAIADVAGGPWPTLALKAALKLSGTQGPSQSIGTELLSDIQEIFEIKRVDRISSADLIAALCEDPERPWATYNRGKQITPRQVSKRLSEYGISSKTIRIGHETPKGYERDHFQEAFNRYLGLPPENFHHTPQPAPIAEIGVADSISVAETVSLAATIKASPNVGCGGVADTGGEKKEAKAPGYRITLMNNPKSPDPKFLGPAILDDIAGPFPNERRRRDREGRL